MKTSYLFAPLTVIAILSAPVTAGFTLLAASSLVAADRYFSTSTEAPTVKAMVATVIDETNIDDFLNSTAPKYTDTVALAITETNSTAVSKLNRLPNEKNLETILQGIHWSTLNIPNTVSSLMDLYLKNNRLTGLGLDTSNAEAHDVEQIIDLVKALLKQQMALRLIGSFAFLTLLKAQLGNTGMNYIPQGYAFDGIDQKASGDSNTQTLQDRLNAFVPELSENNNFAVLYPGFASCVTTTPDCTIGGTITNITERQPIETVYNHSLPGVGQSTGNLFTCLEPKKQLCSAISASSFFQTVHSISPQLGFFADLRKQPISPTLINNLLRQIFQTQGAEDKFSLAILIIISALSTAAIISVSCASRALISAKLMHRNYILGCFNLTATPTTIADRASIGLKLSALLFCIWVRNEHFDPQRIGLLEAGGIIQAQADNHTSHSTESYSHTENLPVINSYLCSISLRVPKVPVILGQNLFEDNLIKTSIERTYSHPITRQSANLTDIKKPTETQLNHITDLLIAELPTAINEERLDITDLPEWLNSKKFQQYLTAYNLLESTDPNELRNHVLTHEWGNQNELPIWLKKNTCFIDYYLHHPLTAPEKKSRQRLSD